jgi:type VI secretion system protein ImpA
MDIDALLAPVSAQWPCGEDLAFSPELDAIARARQADDPSIEQGAWVTTLKEADWKFVAAGCTRLLLTRSKDLRLAVWLAEAAAKVAVNTAAKPAAFRALGDAVQVTAGLCERYWDGLHPLPDEDSHEPRIGNLCWLAARVAQLARALPLTPGASGYSLDQFAFARAQAGKERETNAAPILDAAELDAARRRASPTFYRQLLDDVAYCEQALLALEKVIDARLGADGPGFSGARAALQDVAHFAAPMADSGTPPGGPATSEAPATQAAQAAPAAPVAPLGPLQTRAQALAQLRAVAAFFRQTEPHSPVAYLADKAAHWGEQPLHVWLRAVIKDDVQYAQLEEMLGAQGRG